jgi:hypothetical protein
LWNKQELRQKKRTWACMIYFVDQPFSAITVASILGYVSISLAHLATGIVAHSSSQSAPAPSSWMGSGGVQHSLSHTTDSQLDWGLGFD